MNTTNFNGWSNDATRLVWKNLEPQNIEDLECKRALLEAKIDAIECPIILGLIKSSKIHWEEIIEIIY